jgi:hypothetical protein
MFRVAVSVGGLGWERAGVPDPDHDPFLVGDQPQPDRGVCCRRAGDVHRVGDQLRDQEFGSVCGCLQAPFPEHLAGVQPGAGHRAGQRARSRKLTSGHRLITSLPSESVSGRTRTFVPGGRAGWPGGPPAPACLVAGFVPHMIISL